MLNGRFLFLTIGLMPLALFAQTAPPPPPFPPPPGGFSGLRRLVVTELGFGGTVVTGQPYSAQAVTQSSETLSDGTHINRSTTVSLVRDSQGRTRRQEVLSGSAAPANAPIFIVDPVAQMNYILNPAKKTAQALPFRTPPVNVPPRPPRPPSTNNNVTTVSLGSNTINGVPANGTQITRTIPAGQIGNDKPIQIVNETWFSPDLQVVVQSKHTDPRQGETDYSLTNIVRSEPDPSLFTIPADYRTTSAPQRRGARGSARRQSSPNSSAQ